MTTAKLMALGLLVVTLAVAGCTDAASKPAAGDPGKPAAGGGDKKGDEHTHGKGPNGGLVFDLGKYHAEFTVDHTAKACTVLVLTDDAEDAKPLPVAAKEFTLTTKEAKGKDGTVVPPITVMLLPNDMKDGKAARFVGTDPGFATAADFAGTVAGEIDGKPSSGEFKE
jgi:hypothetical protein